MIEKLRDALWSGAESPESLAADVLGRANSNAGKNVYIALDAERAMRQAKELASRLPKNAKPSLYGLPVSLKDCFDLGGFATSCGSALYAALDGIKQNDSAVASCLRAQGAVIVGKTHLHPLAYGITGENPDYGDCTQPRDTTRLTGGSSSGAAASVQEGSGLAGYRASIDLANEQGLWLGCVPLAQSFDTLGWIFRDLEDGPLLAQALFGLPIERAPGKRPRIAQVGEEFLRDCTPNVMDVFERWQDRLRAGGAEIVSFDTSYWEDAMSIYAPIQAYEAAAIHIPRLDGDFSRIPPGIAERLAWCASLKPTEIKLLRRRHAEFRERIDALFNEFDYVILPCAPIERLMVGADHSQTRPKILRYTVPMSLAGAPVITLPDTSGAGVQLCAARGQDARLVAFAAQFGSRET